MSERNIITDVAPRRRLTLIWADRVAIGLAVVFVMIWGVGNWLGGQLSNEELLSTWQFGATLIGIAWLLMRVIDFIFSGRVRY